MRNTIIKDLLRTVRLNGPALKRADPEALLGALGQVDVLADAFVQRVKDIEADVRLTSAGRADAIRTAGRETLDALSKWEQPRHAGLDENERVTRAKLAATLARPKPADLAGAVNEAMLRAEYRRVAASLSEPARQALFANGDTLVREALSEAVCVTVNPQSGIASAAPYVTPDFADGILMADAERSNPELGDALHDIRETRSGFVTVAGALRKLVSDATPAEPSTPAPPMAARPIRTGATVDEALSKGR